jgi:hypothetical protein
VSDELRERRWLRGRRVLQRERQVRDAARRRERVRSIRRRGLLRRRVPRLRERHLLGWVLLQHGVQRLVRRVRAIARRGSERNLYLRARWISRSARVWSVFVHWQWRDLSSHQHVLVGRLLRSWLLLRREWRLPTAEEQWRDL